MITTVLQSLIQGQSSPCSFNICTDWMNGSNSLTSNQTCYFLIVFLEFFLPFLCPSLCSLTYGRNDLCYFRNVISLLWSDPSVDALTFKTSFLSTPSLVNYVLHTSPNPECQVPETFQASGSLLIANRVVLA